STYSANSHYWLGQLYFAKKQDKDAVKSFAAVVSYKDSNKRADALLKLGEIAERNNNAAQAKKYYQQVVDEYPGSASAKLAGSKLK
ncbi:tol-pal system protein YbgF, partial [Escherichia coli]|nr:tol-pal system protein YbgF [Escherichia coli]